MKIEVGKTYLSNGEPIRILCTDRNDKDYTVVGLRDDGAILSFKNDGLCFLGPKYDLIEVCEQQEDKADTKISMSKKYTSGGDPIRILCIDRNHERYPVIGLSDNGDIMYFEENGRYVYSDELYGDAYDLVEVLNPLVGEFCLFWDDGVLSIIVLSKLNKVLPDGTFQSWHGISWKNCTKFTGELPNQLKGI
jgi:hypothetical protein